MPPEEVNPSALHTMLLPFGKGVVKDACLRKFSQCLIVNGCLIAKVVLDTNELVPNNDEQVPNNDGLVPNNKMAGA